MTTIEIDKVRNLVAQVSKLSSEISQITCGTTTEAETEVLDICSKLGSKKGRVLGDLLSVLTDARVTLNGWRTGDGRGGYRVAQNCFEYTNWVEIVIDDINDFVSYFALSLTELRTRAGAIKRGKWTPVRETGFVKSHNTLRAIGTNHAEEPECSGSEMRYLDVSEDKTETVAELFEYIGELSKLPGLLATIRECLVEMTKNMSTKWEE